MRWFCATACLVAACTLLAQDRSEKKKALFEPLPPIAIEKLERREPVDFSTEIQPILESKCEVCHCGPVKEGRYDLSTFEGLKKGGKSGPAIVPGKPDESLLIKLAGRTGVPPMPPKDDEPLTPKELALLKLWIAQGAKGPGGATAAAKAALKLAPLPKNLRTISALALSADKTKLAVGQAGRLQLYDPPSGQLLRSFVDPDLGHGAEAAAQRDAIHALAFSPDGKLLAAAGFQEATIWESESGKIVRKLGGFSDRVLALDFSPDGKWLAAAGGAPTGDGELILFDVADGRSIAQPKAPHTDAILAVRFRPDGKLLATASADKFIKVFSLPDGQPQRSFEGHTHHVQGVDWRADGALLISASADQTLKVWDYASGDQVRTIGAHGRAVNCLAALRGQPWSVSAGDDGAAKLWNIDNGAQIRAFGGAGDVLMALAVAPDGSLVATGGAEGIIRIYNGATAQLTQTINVSK
jgi:hypothetical protein